MTRPTSYCPKYLERRLLALSGVERVSIISLGDMSTRIVVTGGDNIVIAGSILRNFRLRMPGVFSLIGEVQVSLLHRGGISQYGSAAKGIESATAVVDDEQSSVGRDVRGLLRDFPVRHLVRRPASACRGPSLACR